MKYKLNPHDGDLRMNGGMKPTRNQDGEMQQYIGTKIIQAEPAFRASDGAGSSVIVDTPEEAPSCLPNIEEGYRVRYPDGYESWSPAAAFEEAYRRTDGMSFGLAIEAAKKGRRVARRGWNGKEQYVEIATDISYTDTRGRRIAATHEAMGSMAFVFVGTSGAQIGWLATQSDMLADDWMIVE